MQWLTMSTPTTSGRPARAASSTFVPTPSVEATSTGWSSCFNAETSSAPPKLPIPLSTSGVWVRSTLLRSRLTARLPSSMSTPAAA